MVKIRAFIRHARSAVWLRAVLFTASGLFIVVASLVVSALLPSSLKYDIGQDAVTDILQILASSMLVVTTFSLTVMLTAYSAASSSGTPRSTQLLVQDRTSQNALSTFIGVFAFSIMGLVALYLDFYDENGITLLFIATLAIVVIVIITLLRWVSFLTRFGRHSDVVNRVGDAAEEQLREYSADHYAGAQSWVDPPSNATPIKHDGEGFVTWIEMSVLQSVAEKHDLQVWVLRQVGSRQASFRPIVLVNGLASHSEEDRADITEQLLGAFIVASHRTYEHDPRLGLIALSEISLRAMSPAVNDPGTSIEVLTILQRVLAHPIRRFVGQENDDPAMDIRFDRVYMKALEPIELLHNGFRPTAVAGAGDIQVASWMQRELGRLFELNKSLEKAALNDTDDPEVAKHHKLWDSAVVEMATEAYDLSMKALDYEPYRLEITRLHEQAFAYIG